jgi:hypothetical protein
MTVGTLVNSVSASTYYVSKTGSDSNAGTSSNSALLTIQKAASAMQAGDTCLINSGTYRETVTPAHSGTPSQPITFGPLPGATAIISGADVLSLSWTVYSNSIYQASTSKSFNQLFVDGQMMNIARWPNAAPDQLLSALRSAPSSCTYTNLVDASLPNVNLLGATLHIFPNEFNNQGYAANTRRITGWNPSTKTISWSGNIFNTGATGTLYYVYGALSLLDIPTEWFLDTIGQTLYLWTPDGASPTNHVVEIKNRTEAFQLDNHSYIVVTGLYVFGAGISMANTTNCVVDNCNVLYAQHNTTADWTMDVPIANQVSGSGSIWRNSTIRFSSQDGIRCSGQGEMVSNCVIQQVDYYPGTYYAGVTAFSGGSGTKILNNSITFSGRYCAGTSAPGVEIAYNDLGFGTMLTSDGGATYEYVGAGNGNGTAIHHNWAHNTWAGIYIDAFQNNYLAYRNVCYSNYIGMLFNEATNNLIINNTSVSNTSEDLLFNGSGDTGVKLINNVWQTTQATYGSTTVTDDGWYPPLGTNYVPQSGSGAIDGGVIYSPYTDGFVGAAPDIGAYESGGVYWIPGASFQAQPFPNTYALPILTTQPVSQTNYLFQTAQFTVTATSVTALSYQWLVDLTGSGVYTNIPLGTNYSGMNTNMLTIQNVTSQNQGNYIVVLTNANGTTISAAAHLTVLDPKPAIANQPANQTNIAGQTATFTVAANGLPPLSYHWKSGVSGSGVYSNLTEGGQYSGTTNATLDVANIAASNAADYLVVITNSSGSVTSDVVSLTVITNIGANYLATILPDKPTSYWPLNETSGTVIHDVVGTNNGTCINTSGIVLGGPGILSGQGVTDSAIYFINTNSGYIQVPYSSSLNTPQFTVEVWLNLPSFPVNGATADMNPLTFQDSNPKGWAFEITNPNTSSANMYGWIGAGSWTMLSTGPCIENQWSYYALTYDGTNFTVYTNGLACIKHTSGYTMVSSLHNLLMGAYNSGGVITRFYSGGMERTAVYPSALPSARIYAHYVAGTSGESVGPASISIQSAGNNITLTWATGFLQRASSPSGPWSYVTNAVSPTTFSVTSGVQFFRATLQPPQ